MHFHHTSWFLLCALCGLFFLQFGVVASDEAQSPSSSSPSSSSATGTLRQIAYLKTSNPEGGDHFGCGGALDGHAGNSIAISGDGNTIAIGAPHESGGARGINGNQNDNSIYSSGAVYVFTRNGPTSINGAGAPPPRRSANDVPRSWTQQAYVKASNPGQSDNFGTVVALSADGNTMAVSAVWEASNATGVNGNQAANSIPQAGAVYVFVRKGTAWSQQAYLKASNTGEAAVGEEFANGDQFGFSLALSDDGNTIAVGAISEDSTAPGINSNQADNSGISAGAVYVFVRTGNAWSQQAYVKPSNIDAGDLFGYAVSLNADGNTLAVGSYDEDGSSKQVNGTPDNLRNGSGAVYVFTRAGGNWSQQAYIKTLNAEAGDSLGVSVGLSDDGNTLLTGSLDEDCLSTGVNAPGCDAERESNTSAGAAYVFVRNGPPQKSGVGSTWTQQAYLKPSQSGIEDWFGARLALSGDGNTVAVGASLEDSAAQGINGRQDDDSATQAGAVFFFTRSGTTWAQQAYVKGSNTEAFDEFGGAMALSRDGRTMVVGAHGEDSAARGVNGNQADNSADEAGAAYVFTYN